MKVKDCMVSSVIYVKESDTVEYATRLLLDNNVSGVPVVDENMKVVGVLSESDLIYQDKDIRLPSFIPLLGGFIMLESIRKFEKQLVKMSGYKVKQVMSDKPITIYLDDEISEAVNKMLDNKINRLPVVNKNDELVGIVTRSDILRHIRRL